MCKSGQYIYTCRPAHETLPLECAVYRSPHLFLRLMRGSWHNCHLTNVETSVQRVYMKMAGNPAIRHFSKCDRPGPVRGRPVRVIPLARGCRYLPFIVSSWQTPAGKLNLNSTSAALSAPFSPLASHFLPLRPKFLKHLLHSHPIAVLFPVVGPHHLPFVYCGPLAHR